MKLELVMLATAFSMITERHVEAQLKCFEKRDFTGKEATITKSTQDTASLFPNGLGACKVLAKYTLIFYSKPNYKGDISTFNGGDKRIFPRSRFNTRSILMIGSPTIKKGLFLFQKEDFQGGVFQSFNGEVVNVQGKITFGSVVVIGEFEDWTVARSCHKSNCERKCLVCFKRAKSRASFFRSINSTGMGGTKTILPGACLGTNYDGESDIPECPCNQYGVVPGPNQCKGDIYGKCLCNRKAYFTGDDCDSCQHPRVYKDGKCIGHFTIYSGQQPVELPGLLPQYKITCNGNCMITEIKGLGTNFIIAASENPVLVKESGGCYNCFCESSEKGVYQIKTCKKDGSNVINLQSNSFYITMVPDQEVQGAQVEVRSNFKAITKFDLMKNQMIQNLRINGKPGAVWRFAGPIQGEHIQDFYIDFKLLRNDRHFSVEILTDADVTFVYVTKANYYAFKGYCQGQCTSCSCDTRKKCESFDSYLDSGRTYTEKGVMAMKVGLNATKSIYRAYLRISGNQFQDLRAVKYWKTCS